MKNKVLIKMIFPLFSVSIFFLSCQSEAKLDGTSEMFKDYSKLESVLSSIPTHPDSDFISYMDNFINDYHWNFDLSKVPDGIYETFSVPDRYTYVHFLRFEVKDHQFRNVYYNEYLEKDIFINHFSSGGEAGKRSDETYYSQMRIFGTDAKLWEAYTKMEQELLEHQNPEEVDGITGASLAVNRFQILIMKALYEYKKNIILNEKKYTIGEEVDLPF